MTSPSGLPALARRLLCLVLVVSTALLPLAGCQAPPRGGAPAAPPAPTTLHIAAVIVGEQRLAGRDETVDLAVWRAGARLPGRAGMLLQRGDRVATGRDVTVVIRWPRLGDAYLRGDSAATLGSLEDLIGRAFVRVQGFFAAQTKVVGSIAKGTAFALRAAPDGTLEITVFESAVEVVSRQGRWAPVTMRVGETAVAGLRAPRPAPASPAELQATREWVERVERLLASAAPRSERSGPGVGTALVIGIGALLGAILLSRGNREAPAPPAANAPPAPATGTSGADRPAAPAPAPANPPRPPPPQPPPPPPPPPGPIVR